MENYIKHMAIYIVFTICIFVPLYFLIKDVNSAILYASTLSTALTIYKLTTRNEELER